MKRTFRKKDKAMMLYKRAEVKKKKKYLTVGKKQLFRRKVEKFP